MTAKLTAFGRWDGAPLGFMDFDDGSVWPYMGPGTEAMDQDAWRRLGQAYLHLIEPLDYTHKDAVADLMKVRRALRKEGRL
jgi:hypothetical protein